MGLSKVRAGVTVALLAASALSMPSHAATIDVLSLVNPLSGTLGAGFPTVGAGVPFGMVTPGPATTLQAGDDPLNYVGYGYQDTSIRGFPLTHFDGAGVHIGGEIPIMPTTGAIQTDPTRFASPYSHLQETAQPGRYQVQLAKYGIGADLTAMTRTAYERFSFPKTTQANLLFDLGRDNDSTTLPSSIRFVDANTVTGSVYVPASGGFTIWFSARFDRPMTAHGTWSNAAKSTGGWVRFDASKDATLTAKIAISYVSAEGAAANLAAVRGRSFESVSTAAQWEWRSRLHSVHLRGGAAGELETFYSNLYRALLMPDIADDLDGNYRGFDDKIRKVAVGHHHYTGLSLWDTYRTQTPMLALLAKDVAHDVGISLLDDTDQNSGVIPKWVQGNRDYSIMNGDSGTPTLASLVTNGALTGADAMRAYRAVLHQATTKPVGGPRDQMTSYLKYGYVPSENAKASMTLEYASDDAAVAELAKTYGTPAEVAAMTKRAGYWRNLMSPSDHFLRPRNRDGSWSSPTDLGLTKTWNPAFPDGWTEGTGWQYLWSVPQDVGGLVTAMGGVGVARQRLDSFFTTQLQSAVAPVLPEVQSQASFFGVAYYGTQFTPANEPDLQAPWLYNWVGQPWKAQKVLHAASRVWSSSPVFGLPGNDDTGSMSAWYVLTAMGLYQPQPGSPYWVLSSPLFDSVRLPGLTIEAPRSNPLQEYVGSATLSGHALTRSWLTPREVSSGRTLHFVLTSSEGSTWASGKSGAPPSLAMPR